jgi:hypothetical protein
MNAIIIDFSEHAVGQRLACTDCDDVAPVSAPSQTIAFEGDAA